MTATINGIDSVLSEIDRLHSILADDVAELHRFDASDAATEKVKVAEMLEHTRLQLESLKGSQNKWARNTLKLR